MAADMTNHPPDYRLSAYMAAPQLSPAASTTSDIRLTSAPSFTSKVTKGPHPKYYVSELVTLSVEGCLFRIPKNMLLEGQHFVDLFSNNLANYSTQGRYDENPIVLEAESGIDVENLECFLEVLTVRSIEGDANMEFKGWVAALKIATMWSFQKVKEFCIKQMDTMVAGFDPFEQIRLADECGNEKWLRLAFKGLGERTAMLKADEGVKLGYRRFAALTRVREQRNGANYRCGCCTVCKPSAGSSTSYYAPTGLPSLSWEPGLSRVCHKDAGPLIDKEPDLLVIGL